MVFSKELPYFKVKYVDLKLCNFNWLFYNYFPQLLLVKFDFIQKGYMRTTTKSETHKLTAVGHLTILLGRNML